MRATTVTRPLAGLLGCPQLTVYVSVEIPMERVSFGPDMYQLSAKLVFFYDREELNGERERERERERESTPYVVGPLPREVLTLNKVYSCKKVFYYAHNCVYIHR